MVNAVSTSSRIPTVVALVFLSLFLLLLTLSAGKAVAAVGDNLGCLSGDCENGHGLLVVKDERGLVRYTGKFIDGKYHGFGKLELLDQGRTYKGNFMLGMRHGRGSQWDREGSVYIGMWRNDKRNGQGLQAYRVQDWTEDKHTEHWLSVNTENYQGGFRNNVFDGEGTYRWADGITYTGGWAGEKKHGRGYFLYPGGLRSDRNYHFNELVSGEPLPF